MAADQGSDTVVVIPTFNEAENIGAIVPAVLQALVCDVLVVDDGSPDGTAERAEQLARSDTRIRVIRREQVPRGLGPSYLEGFGAALAAGYSFVVQMDADFSHDPAAVSTLRRAAENADLVIGSRWVPGGEASGWKLPRRMISRGGSFYARWALGLDILDVTSGFKCWRAQALRSINLASVSSLGFVFQVEMNHRASLQGLRIVEVPIRFVDRRIGVSKMSAGIFLEGLAAVWRLRGSGRR